MAQDSPIEWTDATWNPVRGCSRISAGCGGPNHQGGCYAEKIAARFSDPGQAYEGLAERTPHGGRWTGAVRLVPDQLTVPMRWRKPRRIFVNSMSDLFHESLSFDDVDQVMAAIALCPQHTMQVLTKRDGRMRAYFENRATQGNVAEAARALDPERYEASSIGGCHWWPLPNLWLGVSIEDQANAGRLENLRAIRARVRFVSAEPLLGPLVLGLDPRGERGREGSIYQVICGGESGPRKRPTDVAWHRALRDECAAAGVAFFEKQIDKVQPIPEDLMVRQFPEAACS